MRIVNWLSLTISAALEAYLRRDVWPEDRNEPVPPIRYDGDPTEIYLA